MLDVIHPVRLELVLNYAVYLYEVKTNSTKAYTLLSENFEDAIKQIDNVKPS